MILIGSFNRIFTLKFDNGSELIAKIPFPLLTPRHLCTASEVATMDYARALYLDYPFQKCSPGVLLRTQRMLERSTY
jgi:hypothetical protein